MTLDFKKNWKFSLNSQKYYCKIYINLKFIRFVFLGIYYCNQVVL